MPSAKKKKARAQGAGNLQCTAAGPGPGSGADRLLGATRKLLQTDTTVVGDAKGTRKVNAEEAPAPAQPSYEATRKAVALMRDTPSDADAPFLSSAPGKGFALRRDVEGDGALADDDPFDGPTDCAIRLQQHVALYQRRKVPPEFWPKLAANASLAHELFDEMVLGLADLCDLWSAISDRDSDLRSAHWTVHGASRSLTFEENVAILDERGRGLELRVWDMCGWLLLEWLFEDELIEDGRMVEMLIAFHARTRLRQAGICAQDELQTVQPIDLFAAMQVAWLGLGGSEGDYRNVNLARIEACTDCGCHTVQWAYANGWQFESTGCGSVHEWLERLKTYFARQALPTPSRSPGGRPTNAIIDLVHQVKPGSGSQMWKTVDATLLAECLEREDVIAFAKRMFGQDTPLPLGRASSHPKLEQACVALVEVLVSLRVQAWFGVHPLWSSRVTELIQQLQDPSYTCRDRLYSAARAREDGRHAKQVQAKKRWGVDWSRAAPINPFVREPQPTPACWPCEAGEAPRYWLFSVSNTGTSFTAGVREVFMRYHPDLPPDQLVRLCDRRLRTARADAPNLVVVKFDPLAANTHLRYEARRAQAGLVARPAWRTGPERLVFDYARSNSEDHWDGVGDKPRVNVRLTRRSHPTTEVDAADLKRWRAGLFANVCPAITEQDQSVQLLLRGVVGLEYAVTKPSTSASEWGAGHPEQSPLFRAVLGAMRHSFLLRFWDPDFPRDDEPLRFVEEATLYQAAAQILVVLAVVHKLRAMRAIKNPYKRPVLREMDINARVRSWEAVIAVNRHAWTVRQPLWRCAGCGRLEPPDDASHWLDPPLFARSGVWTHNDEYNYRLDGRPAADSAGTDLKRVLSFECGGWAQPVACPKDCNCVRCAWLRRRGKPNGARYHSAACRQRDVAATAPSPWWD